MKAFKSLQAAAFVAYISSALSLLNIEVLFFGGVATPFLYFVLDLPMLIFYFFIVAALPSPVWGRICGYSACVLNVVIFVAFLHHLPAQFIISFTAGVFALRALWIAASSWDANIITKIVGVVLAFVLASKALIPALPNTLTVVQTLLLLLLYALWFLLIARMLVSKMEQVPTLLTFPVR